MPAAACPLCAASGEQLLWQDASLRIVDAAEADYPGFCRVIWQAHVAELSDLDDASREHLLKVVLALERAVRRTMQPDKVNLASLGNQVPHLHWHVIPRFGDDRHFPASVWSAPLRDVSADVLRARHQRAAALATAIVAELR
ncbi:MAG: HIT family protein [Janthinobacterium lividum]